MNSDALEQLKTRFGDTVFKNKGRTFDTALSLAYADMSRRASGHKKDVKDKCIEELNRIFSCMPSFKCQTDFDEWHKKSCESLKQVMHYDSFEGTYGRAQKVINMAFKYLMYTDTPHADAHNFCHMTLDSYTLAWYKRSVNTKSKSFAWSKIDDYEEYRAIQDDIRSYLASDKNYSICIKGLGEFTIEHLPSQPILAEFIIWEGEKIFEKYGTLVNSITSYKESGNANDSWLIGDSFKRFLVEAFK
ncbi:MAG: hypothetical protein IKX86_01675 [Clostridia bacterium]|nr:hypothetical protein [Clostridia bacterium]